MDLQTAKLIDGTRPQWARLSALVLFAIAGALLVSSLTDGSVWRRSEVLSVMAQS
jgi:hypothetical protein